jgi:murein DD-endopeptidase MepM/ murein hydrolase activator NlpD
MNEITPHINPRGSRRALALLVAAALAAAGATATAGHAGRPTGSLRVVSTTLSTKTRPWSYGWPVKPFDRQHPVRAFLNDPRIGAHGGKAFHFGIDVSAPDGTPVYAVEAGTVYFDSKAAIAVVAPDRSHSFGYWHIVPVVKSHQLVARHQLLGYVGAGWEHVHFAERRAGQYVNPLRDGGIGPYVDRTAPSVDSISLVGSDLVVTAHDTPDPRVPGAWADEPVTPALIRWRVGTGSWRIAADFRAAMLPQGDFGRVYTQATRQNHKGEPGCFSFYLERGCDPGRPQQIEVEVTDTAGNRTVVSTVVGSQL